MTLTMIQPIGNSPYAAPRSAALAAIGAGMRIIPTATTSAVPSPASAATWARTRRAANKPSSTNSGSPATSVESVALWSGL